MWNLSLSDPFPIYSAMALMATGYFFAWSMLTGVAQINVYSILMELKDLHNETFDSSTLSDETCITRWSLGLRI